MFAGSGSKFNKTHGSGPKISVHTDFQISIVFIFLLMTEKTSVSPEDAQDAQGNLLSILGILAEPIADL